MMSIETDLGLRLIGGAQVYGFGAKKKAEGKSGTAHHCFALNGNESDVRSKRASLLALLAQAPKCAACSPESNARAFLPLA
jgi:hypothetical protein